MPSSSLINPLLTLILMELYCLFVRQQKYFNCASLQGLQWDILEVMHEFPPPEIPLQIWFRPEVWPGLVGSVRCLQICFLTYWTKLMVKISPKVLHEEWRIKEIVAVQSLTVYQYVFLSVLLLTRTWNDITRCPSTFPVIPFLLLRCLPVLMQLGVLLPTVPIQSTHLTKDGSNTQMCSCASCLIDDALGGSLCGLGTATHPRMHFAGFIKWTAAPVHRMTVLHLPICTCQVCTSKYTCPKSE